MQRTRTARRKRLVSLIVSLSLLVLLVVFDQFSKNYFEKLYRSNGNTSVIDGFFSFTYVVNKGAAWSFLADKSWGQTFFKILTIIALVLFVFFYIVSFLFPFVNFFYYFFPNYFHLLFSICPHNK